MTKGEERKWEEESGEDLEEEEVRVRGGEMGGEEGGESDVACGGEEPLGLKIKEGMGGGEVEIEAMSCGGGSRDRGGEIVPASIVGSGVVGEEKDGFGKTKAGMDGVLMEREKDEANEGGRGKEIFGVGRRGGIVEVLVDLAKDGAKENDAEGGLEKDEGDVGEEEKDEGGDSEEEADEVAELDAKKKAAEEEGDVESEADGMMDAIGAGSGGGEEEEEGNKNEDEVEGENEEEGEDTDGEEGVRLGDVRVGLDTVADNGMGSAEGGVEVGGTEWATVESESEVGGKEEETGNEGTKGKDGREGGEGGRSGIKEMEGGIKFGVLADRKRGEKGAIDGRGELESDEGSVARREEGMVAGGERMRVEKSESCVLPEGSIKEEVKGSEDRVGGGDRREPGKTGFEEEGAEEKGEDEEVVEREGERGGAVRMEGLLIFGVLAERRKEG